ncbi:MAG TPA: efflux RND transporter periplasmic adaptor subunit [Candidatus Choladocola avistercoris]|nr:efflux RND transporter periplasmic adaptor subunit [Candidatus Choladocola avistercoris]
MTAPISGVITAMNVEVGDTYMGENSALFSVADNENFVVSANVDEYDISSISEGMEAAVIVEALGEDELPATVSFVSPTVTTSSMGSSTYAIEIALDDVNTDLRIGMTAQASIVLEAAYDVLTVPYDCVETDEDGNSVVYVDQDGERTAVSVEVGMQGDYYVEVSGDGLDENTFVYYNTPLVNSEATDSGDDSGAAVTFTGGGGGGMPGGGGGMPGGGGPGGGF